MFCDGDFDPWSIRKGNELTHLPSDHPPTNICLLGPERLPPRLLGGILHCASRTLSGLSPPGINLLSYYSTDSPRHRILLPDAVHQVGNMWVTSFTFQTSSQGQRTDAYIRPVGDFPKGSRIGCLAIKGNSSLLSSVFITVLIGVSRRSPSCRRRDLEQH